MNSPAGAPRLNTLLAALPDLEWQRVRCNLKLVSVPLGEVLHEPGVQLDEVYFPTTAIVSLQYELADGTCAEMAVVGSEGVVGTAVFMGGNTTPSRAVVESPGLGYRLKGQILKQEFQRGGAMQHLLLRYTQALITQMAQTAVCNRHHSVDQQLCRWLLGRLDRLDSSDLITTHELIADRLGVRRESVTDTAGDLQHSGLIRYRRGHITVVDRAGLEARCCECYAVVRQETDRLLPVPDRFADIAALKAGMSPRPYRLVKSHEHAYIAT
jgi:CRP-like cAMP-binding protein